jgi:hypothetical protein
MFVTSDIFDLKRIGRYRDFDWREHLLGGVAVHGSRWLGYEAGARFLVEAAKQCGLLTGMSCAGYSRPGDKRTRPITAKSFERLMQGQLKGAANACSVLLRGRSPAVGSQNGWILFGGEAGGSVPGYSNAQAADRPGGDPSRFLRADFIFPLGENPIETATALFQLAVDILGAEYGYYFVRDDLCFPNAYPYGIGAALGRSLLSIYDSVEIRDWSRYAWDGPLWSEPWPKLRDLYQVNLLSARHTDALIPGIGRLTEWIAAQPGRGRLDDLGQGRWLWTLTDAEMFNLRPLLNEAGLLLTCRPRVYRDLPGGAVNASAATAPE